MVTVKNYIWIKNSYIFVFSMWTSAGMQKQGIWKVMIDCLTVKWMPPTPTVGSKFILSANSL